MTEDQETIVSIFGLFAVALIYLASCRKSSPVPDRVEAWELQELRQEIDNKNNEIAKKVEEVKKARAAEVESRSAFIEILTTPRPEPPRNTYWPEAKGSLLKVDTTANTSAAAAAVTGEAKYASCSLAGLRKRLCAADEKLEEKDKQIEQLKEDIAKEKSRKQSASGSGAMKQLRIELVQTMAELGQAKNALSGQVAKALEREQQFKLLEKNLDRDQGQNSQLHAKHKSLQKAHQQLQTEHKNLKEGHQQLQKEHKRLEEAYQQLQTEQKIQKENKSLEEAHQQLQTEHKHLQEAYQQLQTEQKSQIEHRSLEEAHQRLQIEHEQLRLESQQLRGDRDLLQSQHQTLLAECQNVGQNVQQEQQKLQLECQRLSNLLKGEQMGRMADRAKFDAAVRSLKHDAEGLQQHMDRAIAQQRDITRQESRIWERKWKDLKGEIADLKEENLDLSRAKMKAERMAQAADSRRRPNLNKRDREDDEENEAGREPPRPVKQALTDAAVVQQAASKQEVITMQRMPPSQPKHDLETEALRSRKFGLEQRVRELEKRNRELESQKNDSEYHKGQKEIYKSKFEAAFERQRIAEQKVTQLAMKLNSSV